MEEKEERLFFKGFESKPSITFARSTSLVLNCGELEAMRFDSDGNVYVRGEKVDTNIEVYYAMLDFLGISRPAGGHNLAIYSDEEEGDQSE